jgi:hypothetical protein
MDVKEPFPGNLIRLADNSKAIPWRGQLDLQQHKKNRVKLAVRNSTFCNVGPVKV